MFEILFTQTAGAELERLVNSPADKGLVKQIKKSLGYLATNPKHPSLKTHAYDSISHPHDPGQKVFEAYAQNNTPSAYRLFWCYGPDKKQITIIAITPHP
jgi:hypothetical protein